MRLIVKHQIEINIVSFAKIECLISTAIKKNAFFSYLTEICIKVSDFLHFAQGLLSQQYEYGTEKGA